MKNLFGILLFLIGFCAFSNPMPPIVHNDLSPNYHRGNSPGIVVVSPAVENFVFVVLASRQSDSGFEFGYPFVGYTGSDTQTQYIYEGTLNKSVKIPDGYSGDIYKGERAFLAKS